jgi:biotin carboxyl carrier protein
VKLQARVSERESAVTIYIRDGRVTASIDGRAYELQVHEAASGDYLLTMATDVHNAQVATNPENGQSFEVHLHGKSYEVNVVDPKRLRSGQASGKSDHGASQIVAPMPGKVVKLLVELGAEVEAGAGIVVVEAMKMQNEMKTPKAGTVVKLDAAPGATVNTGDVLAVIE